MRRPRAEMGPRHPTPEPDPAGARVIERERAEMNRGPKRIYKKRPG